MSGADLTAGLGSTHELLVRLLACALGMRGPLHPQAQYRAIREAYPALKKLAIEQLERDVEVPVRGSTAAKDGATGVATVSGREDGTTFAELFRGIELFIGEGTVVDNYAVAEVLTKWVLPLAGRKIEAKPALADGVIAMLRAHHAEHGTPVEARNLSYMQSNFRFTDAFLCRLA
jgi:hypothetical protein